MSGEIISTYRWRQSVRNPKRVVDMVHRRETANRSIPNTVAVCESAEHARLIAAAPELLEVLNMVKEAATDMRGEDFNLTTGQWSKFHAAIAKASPSTTADAGVMG